MPVFERGQNFLIHGRVQALQQIFLNDVSTVVNRDLDDYVSFQAGKLRGTYRRL